MDTELKMINVTCHKMSDVKKMSDIIYRQLTPSDVVDPPCCCCRLNGLGCRSGSSLGMESSLKSCSIPKLSAELRELTEDSLKSRTRSRAATTPCGIRDPLMIGEGVPDLLDHWSKLSSEIERKTNKSNELVLFLNLTIFQKNS